MKKIILLSLLLFILFLTGCVIDYGESFCTETDDGKDFLVKGETTNERGMV